MTEFAAIIIQSVMTLVGVGAFYGAVKTELWWIKRAIERLENKLES